MTSILTNATNTMELPISTTEFVNGLTRRDGGDLIQDAFPQLNDEQREFILTGITPKEWDSMIAGED